jgi:uncharacterized protein (DUF1330 family)
MGHRVENSLVKRQRKRVPVTRGGLGQIATSRTPFVLLGMALLNAARSATLSRRIPGGVMPALLIADIEVTDVAAYEEYQRQVPEYVAAYDGRFILRGGRTQTLEGSWQARRVVIIEFPSMDKLLAFYDSVEFATLKSLRMRASDSRIIAVEESA